MNIETKITDAFAMHIICVQQARVLYIDLFYWPCTYSCFPPSDTYDLHHIVFLRGPLLSQGVNSLGKFLRLTQEWTVRSIKRIYIPCNTACLNHAVLSKVRDAVVEAGANISKATLEARICPSRSTCASRKSLDRHLSKIHNGGVGD